MARHRLTRRVAAPALTLTLALAAGQAQASPLFELAGGVDGPGGFAARFTGAGSSSTYFNPALLPAAEQAFTVGVLVLSDQISLTLDGRTGGNVPTRVGERDAYGADGQPISNATIPTDWLERGCSELQCGAPPFGPRPRQGAGSSGNTRAYQVIGLVTPILDKSLVLGFHALIPLGEFTTAYSFYNDEREQFFSNSLHPEMYSDRLTATSLAFGLGSELTERLSLGLSFTLNLTNTAQAGTYVRDPIDYDQLLLATDVSVKAGVSPHLGLRWQPLDALSISATVHHEQSFIIETGFGAALPQGNESATKRRAVHSFVPWQFGLGARWDFTPKSEATFAAVAGATLVRWSTYLDRQGNSPSTYGDDYAFTDTVAPTVGVRHEGTDTRLLLDVAYVPTPVPPQTGRSNYVDNDRLGLVLGGDQRFSLGDIDLRAGLQLQGHRLLERYQKKDDSLIRDELPDDAVTSTGEPIPGAAGLQTNNPGWPGFASAGWVYGGALTIALLY